MKKNDISRLLSLVLRHNPDKLGISLDENGWTSVAVLLDKLGISHETLQSVVEGNDKQRFAFNADQTRIRANQGHSVKVELELKEYTPLGALFHGTAEQHVNSIMSSGLNKGKRHHVHLATDHGTAVQVGMRSGAAVLLQIDARAMRAEGYKFFQSENGVILTDHVPAKFLARVER